MDQANSVEDVGTIKQSDVLVRYKDGLFANWAEAVTWREQSVILRSLPSLRREVVHTLSHSFWLRGVEEILKLRKAGSLSILLNIVNLWLLQKENHELFAFKI